MKKVLFLILLLGLSLQILHAQGNPFLSNNDTSPGLHSLSPKSTGLLNLFRSSTPFMKEIISFQRTVRERLSDLLIDVKEHKGGVSLALLLGFSFLYGIAHAAGPGHRKVMLISYFISRDSTVLGGVFAGLSLAALHAGSAIFITLLLKLIVNRISMQSVDALSIWMEFATLLAIIVLGIVLLGLKIIELIRGNRKNDASVVKKNARLSVIIASGTIPCAGAVLILLFANSLSVYGLGVISVAAMSLGMAVTLSTVSVITIVLKEGIYRLAARRSRFFTFLHDCFELFGAVLIVGFALLMFVPYISG